MKSKTQNKNAIIAILSVVIAIAAIFTFVPMQFGSTYYTGVWGGFGVSSELSGGLYAEYDITGKASHTAIVDSMSKIKENLEEQGYQSSNVTSIDDQKIRVEIGYPTTSDDGFKNSYTVLNNMGIGAFEFRSSQSETDETLVRVTGKDHIKKISVADYEGATNLIIDFNKSGEEKFEELCKASKTIYVYMGKALQTSFDAENVVSYSQMQLTITDYTSAKDFYYKAMFGAISITLNADIVTINTMTPSLGLGALEGASVTLKVFVGFIIALLVAGFIFFAIKYKMAAVLLMPIIMLNLIIASWALCAVSIVEINVTSLIAVAFGIILLFGGSQMFMGRIAEEYAQGKTIDASITSGRKKALPAVAITSILFIVLFTVIALFIQGQAASASIIIIVFAILNVLTNIVLLPWFVNLFNNSNRKQGIPFGLKQGDNTNV